jgi:hypothetical protein
MITIDPVEALAIILAIFACFGVGAYLFSELFFADEK